MFVTPTPPIQKYDENPPRGCRVLQWNNGRNVRTNRHEEAHRRFSQLREIIRKLYRVHIIHLYFYMELGADSDYISVHHYLVGFYYGDGVCSLHGTN